MRLVHLSVLIYLQNLNSNSSSGTFDALNRFSQSKYRILPIGMAI